MINVFKEIGRFVSGDFHLKELLGKGSIAFGYRVIGVGLAFVLQVIIARKLGAFEFGLYSLCIALIMLLASIARLGLDLGIIRQVAGAIAANNPGGANAWLTKALQIVLFASSLVSILVILSSDMLSQMAYKEPRLSGPLMVFAFVIPATALMNIIAEALKGLKDIGNAAIVQNIIVPLLLLVALLVIPAQFTARDVAFIYIGVSIISFAFGYFRWISVVEGRVVEPVTTKEVARFGSPFFIANIGSMLLTWSDTIVVGLFASAETIASYYAASKLATVTSFILISINAISAPKFTALHTVGDHAGLERLARQSTGVMIALASIPTVLLMAIPTFWLGLFGPQFVQAQFVLLVLTAGQVVNVSCGSVGLLLAMTGHEKAMSKIYLCTALVTICVSIVAGIKWGANGVAMATAAGMATWNVWMLVAVRRCLGFWTFPLLTGRSRIEA